MQSNVVRIGVRVGDGMKAAQPTSTRTRTHGLRTHSVILGAMHPTTVADYQALVAHAQETHVLSSAAATLAWDQETGMPKGGGDLRSRQLEALAAMVHQRSTDPRIGEWLQACESDRNLQQESDAAANVRGFRRDYDRATKLPNTLVAELARLESQAQQVWAEARAASDYARFLPSMERMVFLQQQKADCLRGSRSRWDALADLCEPGMNAASLSQLFAPLRERLVALRGQLDARGKRPDDRFSRVPFEESAQEAACRAALQAIGFDFDRGRLDRSAHPFCTGSFGDVRLTTRYSKDNVLDALGSAMHEGGHGLYEQGLCTEHMGTPLGEAASLGIHESQSRLWENHVGRSRAFWQWSQPMLRSKLGLEVDGYSADDLWRASNRVEPSLIRVEADELTYDLHVMVRFELEQALLDGSLAAKDLPAAWNAGYRQALGIEVPDDRRGCLQDVHWSCGLFGYFPTYTLGNLYAAQFASAVRRDIPDLDDQHARGDFAPLLAWLRDKVHRHGRRFDPAELCRRATGAALSADPFVAYLEQKLHAVYA
jgi:carboxypeptidase Taq